MQNNQEEFDFDVKNLKELIDFFKDNSCFKQKVSIYYGQTSKFVYSRVIQANEKDGKKYPTILTDFVVEEITFWNKFNIKPTGRTKRLSIAITPYNFYLQETPISEESIIDCNPDQGLTNELRNYMVKNYGDAYKQKCIEYIKTTAKSSRNDLEADYANKLKELKEKEQKELAELSR